MRRLGLILPILLFLAIVAFVGHGFLNRGGYGITSGGAQEEAAAFTDKGSQLGGSHVLFRVVHKLRDS